MTIYICGDSTAQTYTPDRAPMTGWGQILGELLPDVRIENRAIGGRSTKSFLAEGRLQKIEEEIQPGDLLLIQFTHNDTSSLVWRHTEPWTSFRNNLSIFVDTTRLAGAIPVLLTPIPGRSWKDGELQPTHWDYPEVIRSLAKEKGVALIDVYEKAFRRIRDLGEAASEGLFMNVEAGRYPAFPDGSKDNVHTQRAGAEVFARIAAEGLRELKLV